MDEIEGWFFYDWSQEQLQDGISLLRDLRSNPGYSIVMKGLHHNHNLSMQALKTADEDFRFTQGHISGVEVAISAADGLILLMSGLYEHREVDEDEPKRSLGEDGL